MMKYDLFKNNNSQKTLLFMVELYISAVLLFTNILYINTLYIETKFAKDINKLILRYSCEKQLFEATTSVMQDYGFFATSPNKKTLFFHLRKKTDYIKL